MIFIVGLWYYTISASKQSIYQFRFNPIYSCCTRQPFVFCGSDHINGAGTDVARTGCTPIQMSHCAVSGHSTAEWLDTARLLLQWPILITCLLAAAAGVDRDDCAGPSFASANLSIINYRYRHSVFLPKHPSSSPHRHRHPAYEPDDRGLQLPWIRESNSSSNC